MIDFPLGYNSMAAKVCILCLIIIITCLKRSYTKDENEPVHPINIKNIEEIGAKAVNSTKISNQRTRPGKRNKILKLKKKVEPGYNFTKEEMEKFKIWPKGIIPYFIDYLSFDITLKTRLRVLLESFNNIAGLGFSELPHPPADDSERWVLFINRRGLLSCIDYTTNDFTNTGVQRVVLGYDCLGSNGGELAATVLALVGVPPQHNEPDRDKHILVIWDNIIPEKRNLFNILNDGEWLFHNIPYDILSAGHYNFHKYTVNGSATIIPKSSVDKITDVGERDGISKFDIWKIRMLYNFISMNRKITKASDCAKMYKPGRQFSSFKLKRQNLVVPRIKPEQYLYYLEKGQNKEISAEKQSNENMIQDISEKIHVTQPLKLGQTHKLDYLMGNIKEIDRVKLDKLDYLPDYDSDVEHLTSKKKNIHPLPVTTPMKKNNVLKRSKSKMS